MDTPCSRYAARPASGKNAGAQSQPAIESSTENSPGNYNCAVKKYPQKF
jgi:hypothetical protein